MSTFNQTAAIRGAIRRTFSRSPVIREVMFKVRREVPKFNNDGSQSKKNAVQYKCSKCQQWIKSTEVSVDHVIPVIDVDAGFEDWNIFVQRLFCGPENLAVLCDTCHHVKTQAERLTRAVKKYSAELDAYEKTVNATVADKTVVKALIKELGRYSIKKKTLGLEGVAARADALRQQLKQIVSY